ncbi:hypothetical protein XENOCAPTIV_014262 [Xenoophorus captivus]|uniref:Uncharacterized protein n=1 Tax=Xenoophorus captivus TaxID=1517983 RepID=A0ABV0RKS9_9TELE
MSSSSRLFNTTFNPTPLEGEEVCPDPTPCRAERSHLVDVAVELFQDLIALHIQDINFSFGRTTAQTPNPHLVRETERRIGLHLSVLSH